MIIKIGEREIEMHYSLRMYMIYENRLDESVDYTKIQLNSYNTILNLFYCAVLSSMQYHKMELDLKFDEFMDWIDTGGMENIPEFTAWFMKNLMLQQELLNKGAQEFINKEAEALEKNNKKSDKKGKSLKNAK
jgi:ATP-dependent Clp protease ATP-binding subunit ClpA